MPQEGKMNEYLKISQSELWEIKRAIHAMADQIDADEHITQISKWLGKILEVVNTVYERDLH
jgi:hypothetical protein